MPRSRRIDPAEYDDEQEETTPRRRRRGASSGETVEYEDSHPGTADDVEDDEDEEPAPRTRSRRRRDEDEEEAPPTKRRRRREPEPEDEDYDDEDDVEDDDEEAAVIPISRGRKAIKKNRPTSEASDNFFSWDEDGQVVKFLDEDPWSYEQHWINRGGKRSFPCMGEDCPLCEIGSETTQKIVYTVVNLSHKKGPRVQTLEVGVTLDESLIKFHEDKKTGPLDRLYWALSRTERSNPSGYAKYNYTITPVKERDLEEDWDVDLDKAQAVIDAAESPSTEKVLGKWSHAKLQKIANETLS